MRDERFGKGFDNVGETAGFRERQPFRGYKENSHREFRRRYATEAVAGRQVGPGGFGTLWLVWPDRG